MSMDREGLGMYSPKKCRFKDKVPIGFNPPPSSLIRTYFNEDISEGEGVEGFQPLNNFFSFLDDSDHV